MKTYSVIGLIILPGRATVFVVNLRQTFAPTEMQIEKRDEHPHLKKMDYCTDFCDEDDSCLPAS